ncbi:unnamed protein product [Lactuca virosa]|uniref:Secreted protein n=1 Tax=Lactuca virosa TaxID=75947 RepID=A0AAU9LVP4_9ASTR|nr:unnamed protein product [Lactuca virosa]
MKHQRRGLWWILSVCTLFLVRPHVHQGLLGNIEESRGGKLEELCNEFKWSKYFQSNRACSLTVSTIKYAGNVSLTLASTNLLRVQD